MRLISIRHGQTHQNATKVTMGQGYGGDLNDIGRMQAQKIAARLKDEHIPFMYVSDLKRAVDTAAEIVKFHPDTKVIYTPALRERKLGIYEGKPSLRWKEAMQNSPLPFHAYRPKSGESYHDLQERVRTFFDQLLQKHSNDTVVFVSHGGTLTMLLLHLLQRPLELDEYQRYKPDHTAMTICDIEQSGVCKIHLLNDSTHLGGIVS